MDKRNKFKIKGGIIEIVDNKRELLVKFYITNNDNMLFGINIPIVQDTFYIQRFLDKFPKIRELLDIKYALVYTYGMQLVPYQNINDNFGDIIAKLEFYNDIIYKKR